MTTYNADNPLSTAPANVVTVTVVAEVASAALRQPAGTLIFVAGNPASPAPLTDKSLYICLPDFATSPTANTMKAYLIKAAMVAA
jgi:hypothetical protein